MTLFGSPRRVVVAAVAAAVLIVAVTIAILSAGDGGPGRDRASEVIGPEGGSVSVPGLVVRVPAGTFAEPTEVRVEVEDGQDAPLYGGISKPRSDTFRVEADGRPRRDVEMRFAVADASDGRLAAITRENESREWEIVPGAGRGEELVVTTRHFSNWAVRLFDKLKETVARALDSLKTAFERVFGIRRREPPACSSPPADARLAVDDRKPDDPLLRACIDQEDGRLAVRVASNRAVGQEFEVPPGMRTRVRGRSLGEAFMDLVNQGYPSGTWRLLPGGGEVALIGDRPERPIEFKPTTQALVFDVMLFAVAGGGLDTTAQAIAKYAGCVYRVATSLVEVRSFDDFAGAARDVWADCADLLPAAVLVTAGTFIGAIKIAAAVFDAFRDVFSRSASVRVEKVEPTVSAGAECGVIDTQATFRTVLDESPRRVKATLEVVSGSVRCTEARELANWYFGSDEPCPKVGNTCPRERGEWTCVAPTAGSHPVVLRCTGPDAEFEGRDVGPPVKADRACGDPPNTEAPGPYDVHSNIGCEPGFSIAQLYDGGACSDMPHACEVSGFRCSSRSTGIESNEVTCTWGPRRIRFEYGA
jgi:hypothetical protein